MDDMRKILAKVTNDLIGEGKIFRSARELAQRAHTLGYVEKPDSFARHVARVIKGDHDTGMETVAVIARTAGLRVPEFLGGAHAANTGQNEALTGDSDTGRDASLQFYEALSDDMRQLIEHLAELDRMGGAEREMAIAGIRYILKGHLAVTGKK